MAYVFLPNGDTVDGQNSIRPNWLGVVNHPIKAAEDEISVGNLPASWGGDLITNWVIQPRKRTNTTSLFTAIEVTR